MTTTVGDDHLYSAGINRQRKRGVAGSFLSCLTTLENGSRGAREQQYGCRRFREHGTMDEEGKSRNAG
jgi:hypothetical protein